MQKKITLKDILIVILRNFKLLMIFSLAMTLVIGSLGFRRAYLDYEAYQEKLNEASANNAIELQKYMGYVEELQAYTNTVDETAKDADEFLSALEELKAPAYTGPSTAYSEDGLASLGEYIGSEEYETYLYEAREYIDRFNKSVNSLSLRVNNLANIVPAQDQPSVTYDEIQKDKFTTGDIVTVVVKDAIGGFVFGFALMFLLIMTVAFISNKINYESQVRDHYDFEIFGCLKVARKSSKNKKINKWLLSLEGLESEFKDEDEAVTYAAANLKLFARDKKQPILLIGSVDEAELKNLTEKLAALTALDIKAGGNVFTSAAALENLAECENIVLVEKLGDTYYNRIDAQMRKISQNNKTLLGAILI